MLEKSEKNEYFITKDNKKILKELSTYSNRMKSENNSHVIQ